MATQAQIAANRENAKHSQGATSDEGRAISSRNNFKHGLCPTDQSFAVLPSEDPDAFAELVLGLRHHYEPQNPVESILVRRLAESEWLRARAVRFQTNCIENDAMALASAIALFLRYQTTHERAFYKALNELQKLRQQTAKAEIGFESQKLKQPAEIRAVESLNLRKEAFQFKNQMEESRKSTSPAPVLRKTTPEIDPGGLEMAA